jgi:hypothetical protein
MIKKCIYLSVLAITVALFACDRSPFGREKKPNVAPEQDTETGTAADALWATYVVSDIDMIVSFITENDLYPKFYMHVPGSSTVSAQSGEPYSREVNINFNNAKCRDGRIRSGEIFVEYNCSLTNHRGCNPNSRYYYDYGFACRVSLNDYRVDGWLIDEFDPQNPTYIYNEITGPRKPPYRWRIAGKLRMLNPDDVTKNIVWDGTLYKTLVNSDLSSVLSYSGTGGVSAITWSNAIVSYNGHVNGATGVSRDPATQQLTSTGDSYRMEIGENNSLVRDFSCYPDKVSTVTLKATGPNSYSMDPRYEEYHPFVSGIVSFTTTDKYPRQIYIGNEADPATGPQCDNSGEVLIKGISYSVNFRK